MLRFGPMPDVGSTEPPLPESRRRILFVDDDPLILRSIARTMRAAEPGWDIVMCEDPTRALELIEGEPVDIVVSDLNMKKLDGAELLVEVQHARPEVVRIVLSAMVDTKQIFRAVPVAHQFITKPFEVSELRAKLRAAFELGELLKSDRLRALVAGDNALPIAPSTFAELSRAVADPRTGVAEMSAIVEEDTGLSAELIRLISSAFFGLPKQVRGVRGAIAYLGVEMLKSLVLKVEIVRAFRVAEVPEGFNVEELQSHALLVARGARRLLVGNKGAEDAFSAGMLHDVGQLVLASRAPEDFAKAILLSKETQVSLSDAEREVFGASHAEVGAYLLGLWGLRQPVVEAVALHHDLAPTRGAPLDVAGAVAIAESEVGVERHGDSGPGVASTRQSGFLRTRLESARPLGRVGRLGGIAS